MKLFRIAARLLPVLALLSPGLAPAIAPAAAGGLALPAPAVALRAATEVPRLVALLQAGGGRPAGLQVIDISQGAAPVLRGFLPLGAGELALSPDGRRALAAFPAEPPRDGAATRHTLVAVDTSDPAAPRQLWRREIQARKLLLAAEAGAWAESRPVSGGGAWATTVHWLDGGRPPQVHADGTEPPQQLSARGAVLGWRNPPGQPRSPRFHCVVAALDSGYLLVEDQRAARMAVYGGGAGLPRVAALPHDGTRHCDAIGTDAQANVLMAGEHGVVRRIGLAQPASPGFNGEWQLPAGLTARAAFGEHLYATGGERLQVFRMDLGNASDVDWPALAQAHQATMARHGAALKAGDAAAARAALAELEQAGAALAPDSPILGIAPRSVAPILEDFGALIAPDPTRFALAEFALKRAIVLDPDRVMAPLHLALLWNAHLPATGELARREKRREEIAALVRRHLLLGGMANDRLRALAQGEPAQGAADFCEAVKRYAAAGRLGELLLAHATGAPIGERRLDLSLDGALYAWDARTDLPQPTGALPEPPPPADAALALAAWGGELHLLRHRDARQPLASVPLAGARGCRFD